jgi:ribulose kinase
MSKQYTIGLAYGTTSVRARIVNVANGAEVTAAVRSCAHDTQGVTLFQMHNAVTDGCDRSFGAVMHAQFGKQAF